MIVISTLIIYIVIVAVRRLKENERLGLPYSKVKYLVYGEGDTAENRAVVSLLTAGCGTKEEVDKALEGMSIVKARSSEVAVRPERQKPYVTSIGVEPSRRTRAERGLNVEEEGVVTEHRYRDLGTID